MNQSHAPLKTHAPALIGGFLALLCLALCIVCTLPQSARADTLPDGLSVEPEEAATLNDGVLKISEAAKITLTNNVELKSITSEHALEIIGSGTLTIPETDAQPGISVGALTIGSDVSDNLTINATIQTTGDCTINGGTLQAVTSVRDRSAISAGANFTMSGGSISAKVINPRGPDYAMGDVLSFGAKRGIGESATATITGGSVTLEMNNESIGVGSGIADGSDELIIGEKGSSSSPDITITMTGIGFGLGTLTHDFTMHSGTFKANVSTGTASSYALSTTNFTMDGGTAEIIAGGSTHNAISAGSTTLSNQTGQSGGGPRLTVYGPRTAFANQEQLNLTASKSGESDFYPWLIQSGANKDSAQVISFAGAANMTSDHNSVSGAGQWVRIQPAEIEAITFTSTASSASPGATVPLTPYVRFKGAVDPAPRFGSTLASMAALIPVDTSKVTVTPDGNVASSAPNGQSGILATIASEAKGRTTTFTPVLDESFTGADGSWTSVYGGEKPLSGLSLPMTYIITFDANDGALVGSSTLTTNTQGLLPASKAPTATKDNATFAG